MQGNNPGGRGLESLIAALACCAALLCYGVQRQKPIVRGELQVDFGSCHYFVVNSTIVPKRAIFSLQAFLS